ncbi:MAG: hypothetical protein EP343_30675 [Deltaproteobacteria bacterium]|nr:MAG: hypothetical protein EP343_30675 [Deltaproteobacteria bacterium]
MPSDFEQPSPNKRLPLSKALVESRVLLGGLVALLVLSNIPYGSYVLYPFELFSTWIHETCHGLAALAVGGTFHELYLYPDTSGRALSSGVASHTGRVIVASAGYMGTTFFGGLLLLLLRPTRFSRTLAGVTVVALLALVFLQVQPWTGMALFLLLAGSIALLAFASPPRDIGQYGLFALGILMLSTLWYARSTFTVASLLVMGGVLVVLGIRSTPAVGQLLFSLLAATCGLNALTSINVLFSPHLTVNGQSNASSDAHTVAYHWFGNHKLWASLWLVFSVLFLGWALWRSITAPTLNLAVDPDQPKVTQS